MAYEEEDTYLLHLEIVNVLDADERRRIHVWHMRRRYIFTISRDSKCPRRNIFEHGDCLWDRPGKRPWGHTGRALSGTCIYMHIIYT